MLALFGLKYYIHVRTFRQVVNIHSTAYLTLLHLLQFLSCYFHLLHSSANQHLLPSKYSQHICVYLRKKLTNIISQKFNEEANYVIQFPFLLPVGAKQPNHNTSYLVSYENGSQKILFEFDSCRKLTLTVIE